MDARVGIVILNWNRLELTKLCLESVFSQTYKNTSIYVIDNGSHDGSAEWLASVKKIFLIKNSKNRGFARAINQGISQAISHGAEYVVSLNNDATLDKDWLKYLVEYMDNHAECGFAQGASMQANNPKLYDSSGIYLEQGFIPNQRAAGKSDAQVEIPVIGPNAAGSIYRTTMLKAVAHKPNIYFDGRFFAYVEDVDLNLRCTMRGYGFGYEPKAKLFHIGSATGNSIAKKKMFWGSRNLVWLVYKNVPLGTLRLTYKKIIQSHLANLQYLYRDQRPNFAPYALGFFVGIITCPWFTLRRVQNMRKRTISDEALFALLVPSNPPIHNPFKRYR